MLEIRESENCGEEIYEEIYDSSLNKKHDCNDFIINSINFNCAKNMQNPKLGDASSSMSTTYNDHDWGDSSYDLENLFKHHDEYEIDNNVCNNIESGFGRVSTLDPTISEECQLCMHVDHVENMLCDSYFVEFAYDPTCNFYEREENMVVGTFMLLNYLSLC